MAIVSATTFPNGSEVLPKVRYRMMSKFGHLCSQRSTVCVSSMHSGHVGSVARSNNWALAMRIGACPDRKLARRTASAPDGLKRTRIARQGLHTFRL